MSTTEWGLVALVVLIPAIVAVIVTLWSLEQVRLRSRKNRGPIRPDKNQQTTGPPELDDTQ